MIKDYYTPLEVYDLTETKGDFGEIVQTYALVGVVDGLINDPGPEKQSIIAAKYQVKNVYNLYTEINNLVKQHTYIKKNGVYYRVITNAKDTVQRGHHLKFILERLDTDEL